MQRLCRLCASAGVAILLMCALLTVADIASRRLLGLSVPGLIDLTQLLVMTSVFLCIPLVFEQRANVEVDLLYNLLPGNVSSKLSALWLFLGAAFLLAAAWHAGRAAGQVLEYGERSPTLALPMICYWIPVLFGMLLAAYVCIHQLLRRATPTEPADTPYMKQHD
ncbi:MAG: TRAP transporter small permease [Variovorax sp.]